MRKAVAGISNVSTVITGHGTERMTWTDFVEYTRFIEVLVDAARRAHAAGRTAAQGASELVLPDEFKNYDTAGMTEFFTSVFSQLSEN